VDAGSTRASNDGCTVTVQDLDVLPDQLEGFGSPKQLAESVGGIWLNPDGDTLEVTPGMSGQFHLSEGTTRGSSLIVPCSIDTEVSVPSKVALSTRDGRFAELLDVDLHLRLGLAPPGQAQEALFKADEPLSDLKGRFVADDPNYGVLNWLASFRAQPGSWDVSGFVSLIVKQPASGGGVGASQGVYVAPFNARVVGDGGTADADAPGDGHDG
jgi:hypothetical protein